MAKLTPEIIRAEFIEKPGTFLEVANKYSIAIEELEAYPIRIVIIQPGMCPARGTDHK